jgi:hypothetical protein
MVCEARSMILNCILAQQELHGGTNSEGGSVAWLRSATVREYIA